MIGKVYSLRFFSIASKTLQKTVQQKLETKLTERFQPFYIRVINIKRAHHHSEEKDEQEEQKSKLKYKIVIVSDEFASMSRIDRHRHVHDTLQDDLKEQVHALSIQADTIEQWKKSGEKVKPVPPCAGHHKHTQ